MKHILTKKNAMYLLMIVFALIFFYVGFGVIAPKWQKTLITAAYYVIGALGLNVIIGVSGQFSLGHAGFMAIGAYSVGVLFQTSASLSNFILGIAIGIVITCLVALVIAIPTFRLRGDYLAIATLGFSEIIRLVIQNMEDVTGGAAGLQYLTFDSIDDKGMFMMMVITIILSLLLIVNFVRSSHGRATVSIREDEIAAEAMGINTMKYKTIAFLIGTSLAAVAGAFVGPMNFVIKPQDFGFQKSIDILVIVVLGGMGSLSGSIIGGIFVAVVNTLLMNYAGIRMILYALALVAVMVIRPEGLLGKKEIPDLFKKVMRKKKEVR